MARTGHRRRLVTVDGGEGGTGAAPLGLQRPRRPALQVGFPPCVPGLREQGLHHDVAFIGSGKLGIPRTRCLAQAMGCDMVNVARTAMFSIGLHPGPALPTPARCRPAVATQSAWLQHGLDPALESVRCANYLATLRFELLLPGPRLWPRPPRPGACRRYRASRRRPQDRASRRVFRIQAGLGRARPGRHRSDHQTHGGQSPATRLNGARLIQIAAGRRMWLAARDSIMRLRTMLFDEDWDEGLDGCVRTNC